MTDEVVLAAVPFFADLDAPVLTALAESAEEVRVSAGLPAVIHTIPFATAAR